MIIELLFLPENINLLKSEIEAVKVLADGRIFFSGDIRANYQAARMAVLPLIAAESFYDDLELIAKGMPFENVFFKTNKPLANDSASGEL